jgi:hypothetical protein
LNKGTITYLTSIFHDGISKTSISKQIEANSEDFLVNATNVVNQFLHFLFQNGMDMDTVTTLVMAISSSFKNQIIEEMQDSIADAEDMLFYNINKSNFIERFNNDETFQYKVFQICSPILGDLGFDFKTDDVEFE